MNRLDLTNDHMLRETFGHTVPIPPEMKLKVSQAILTVAGADGEVSPREMEYFLGLARSMGCTDAILEQLLKFDYRAAKLPDFYDAQTKPVGRHILYDAIHVARQDGFGPKEREAAFRAAKMLGLDPHLVVDIEGLLGIEDAVRAARIRLLSPVE
ncbi:MAG TPA: hypothetical protein VGR28_14350 [Candidatus Thermoplasmatota archaeon]|jgi:uncharacterized tellurite resistance protein B-like protein|nr:hypothetical protein [Candidatus Thermoplasmatota archaeon]